MKKLSSFLRVCGDAEDDGNPQTLDAAFLSTGESVIEILQTLYTLHPCSYSLRRTVLLHYSTIISHCSTLQCGTRTQKDRDCISSCEQSDRQRLSYVIRLVIVYVLVLYLSTLQETLHFLLLYTSEMKIVLFTALFSHLTFQVTLLVQISNAKHNL